MFNMYVADSHQISIFYWPNHQKHPIQAYLLKKCSKNWAERAFQGYKAPDCPKVDTVFGKVFILVVCRDVAIHQMAVIFVARLLK